jgi:hypothetical protein
LKPFEEYFSDDMIIRMLCRQRIKAADKRNGREYVDRLAGYREPKPREPIDLLLPPRKKWSQFRPRFRKADRDVHQASLYHATMNLRDRTPDAGWAVLLNQFIVQIRRRVLLSEDFTFRPPKVRGIVKKMGGHDYRALCLFSLEDGIINGLTAKYLRELLDPLFEGSSYAFRVHQPDKPAPTHHDAFEKIFELKSQTPDQDYHVSECDIRGFYDSVDHGVAKHLLESLAEKSLEPLHPKAMTIFKAYLNCYSFPKNVLHDALPELRERDRTGTFPWPEEALAEFHPEPRRQSIGVPQGGAISCVIANIVLDYADKRIKEAAERLDAKVHYLRYCDDMVLISRNKRHCQTVFSAYLKALKDLKLPFHKPKLVEQYDADFWESKSKRPYRWTGKREPGCVPWVQFVGYQVRHDGLVRIKKGSIEKHLKKLVETTGLVRWQLMDRSWREPTPERSNMRASESEVRSSFRRKLASMGVGRVNPHKPADSPLPKCWANGYRALNGKPLITTLLKLFDRERERQIRRLGRAGVPYGGGSGKRRKRNMHPAKRHPFSYYAQFKDLGGADLIKNPDRFLATPSPPAYG